MKSRHEPNPHTVAEPLTATLPDGKTITGTLWLHPSGIGSFEVEYKEIRMSDGKTNYTNGAHMRAIAKQILREMAEGSEHQSRL